MKQRGKIDKIFLVITLLLVVIGFFIFLSASLGLLAKDGTIFGRVALKQIFLGLFVGIPIFLLSINIPIQQWKKPSPWLYGISLALMCLVFIHPFSMPLNGASRWISVAGFTFQPSELLKFSFVLFMSGILTQRRGNGQDLKKVVLPFLACLAPAALLLVLEPDNDTLMVLGMAGLAMLITTGVRLRYIAGLTALALVAGAAIIFTHPYVMKRVTTFLNPQNDPLGSSYQIRQALIAVGSGQITGRGFGQSIQKFNYLPEPVSDSIFAVAAEEFGFIGSCLIVLIFLLFILRGINLASRCGDEFGRLLTIGFVILIGAQSFMNIAAMVGLFPLSGQPLLFISQGGTALIITLLEAGMILSASKHRVSTS